MNEPEAAAASDSATADLKREKELLQMEVQRLTRQMGGQKTQDQQEIFRHLMRSLLRARKIIDKIKQ